MNKILPVWNLEESCRGLLKLGIGGGYWHHYRVRMLRWLQLDEGASSGGCWSGDHAGPEDACLTWEAKILHSLVSS